MILGKVGVTYEGVWDGNHSTTVGDSEWQYAVATIVRYDNVSYISIQNVPSGTAEPSSATGYWGVIAKDSSNIYENFYTLDSNGNKTYVAKFVNNANNTLSYSGTIDGATYKNNVFSYTEAKDLDDVYCEVFVGQEDGALSLDLMSPVNEVLAAVESIIGTQSN